MSVKPYDRAADDMIDRAHKIARHVSAQPPGSFLLSTARDAVILCAAGSRGDEIYQLAQRWADLDKAKTEVSSG